MSRRLLDPKQAIDLEHPLVELEQQIEQLTELGQDSLRGDLDRLRKTAQTLEAQIFANLTPWQEVQLSRHGQRPYTLDYVSLLCDDFIELAGDRRFGEDAAIVGGPARFLGYPVMVIGHQKGRGTKENVTRNFGMPRPEGYRKAQRLMQLAARMSLPVVTFIDTPGAYPGIDAEERGQAEAIAQSLELMATLPVPIIATIIGEGGSGGALALAVADRVMILEHATYSVISPEGCATILWKSAERAAQAASALKLTASDLLGLGVVDRVIPEPLGGAHRDPEAMARVLGDTIASELATLIPLPKERLLEDRYQRFRKLGAFGEAS